MDWINPHRALDEMTVGLGIISNIGSYQLTQETVRFKATETILRAAALQCAARSKSLPLSYASLPRVAPLTVGMPAAGICSQRLFPSIKFALAIQKNRFCRANQRIIHVNHRFRHVPTGCGMITVSN